jgi:hypothetical protein
MNYIKFLYLPVTLIFLLFLFLTKSKVLSFFITLIIGFVLCFTIADSFELVDSNKIKNDITSYFTSADKDLSEIKPTSDNKSIKEATTTCEDLHGEKVFSHKRQNTIVNPETLVTETVSIDIYNCIIPNLN